MNFFGLSITREKAAVPVMNSANSPGLAVSGRGAWKTHATSGIFDFYGLCGQPLSSVGGPGREDADCRGCRRIMRRAGALP